jgi:hypothetical protein
MIAKRTRFWIPALLLFALVALAGCGDEDDDPQPPNNGNDTTDQDTADSAGTPTKRVSGSLNRDTRWHQDTVYIMEGFVYVEPGNTLTIEPGTVIRGAIETEATLVVKRGAKINAAGTPEAPIIFTSNRPPGERNFGDWGGVIIAGAAPTNQSNDSEVEGGTGAEFGGNEPADNSGVFKYCRIEFSGIPVFPNQELNGLTMAGVGTGTEIHHVQVSYSGDDSFEWFGGTVETHHLVAYAGFDDDFDTDFGYGGKCQFLLGVRHYEHADANPGNGFETDNNPGGSSAQPFTDGIYSNVTLVGPFRQLNDPTIEENYDQDFECGIWLDNRSKISVYNSTIIGWPYGVRIDGPSHEYAENEKLYFKNNVIAAATKDAAHTNQSGTPTNPGFDADGWFTKTAYNNTIIQQTDSLGYSFLSQTSSGELANPNFTLSADAMLASGASFSDSKLQDPFFEPVSYRGAFGSNDWTQGWCNWDPRSTEYPGGE